MFCAVLPERGFDECRSGVCCRFFCRSGFGDCFAFLTRAQRRGVRYIGSVRHSDITFVAFVDGSEEFMKGPFARVAAEVFNRSQLPI